MSKEKEEVKEAPDGTLEQGDVKMNKKPKKLVKTEPNTKVDLTKKKEKTKQPEETRDVIQESVEEKAEEKEENKEEQGKEQESKVKRESRKEEARGEKPVGERREQSAKMLIDAFMPEGINEIAVDSIFMMPQLGVLANIDNPEFGA